MAIQFQFQVLFLHLHQEIFYYTASGNLLRNDDKTTESTSVEIKDAGNKEVVEALTTGDGPLLSGALPALAAQNEAALGEALTSEQVKTPKPPKASRGDKDVPEKQVPKTFEECHTHLLLISNGLQCAKT